MPISSRWPRQGSLSQLLPVLLLLGCTSEVPEGDVNGGSGGAAGANGGAPLIAGGTAPNASLGGTGGAGTAGMASGGGAGAESLAGGAGDGGSQGQAGAAQQAGPAQILCLGDSITEQAASWIYPLQDTLRTNTCRYEFIGLDQSPYNGVYAVRDGYENKRVAAGGFSTTGILNLIKEQGIGGVPDVVVEYLGVNNVYGGFIDGKYNPNNSADPDGSFIRDNKELFAMVRAKNPKATFLLMKIENNLMPQIDAAIDELVSMESTAQSPVIAVANPLNVETSDGVHPTAAGATTLAGPVGKALTALLTAQAYCAP